MKNFIEFGHSVFEIEALKEVSCLYADFKYTRFAALRRVFNTCNAVVKPRGPWCEYYFYKKS